MDVDALPPGLYERLITEELRVSLAGLPLADRRPLGPDDRAALVRHVAAALARELADPQLSVYDQVVLSNSLLQALLDLRSRPSTRASERVAVPGEALLAIPYPSSASYVAQEIDRPKNPLNTDALFINGAHEPRISMELKHELASADRVDLICAFIIWSGVRIFRKQMEGLRRRGVRFRVLTTTYTGITDPRALEALIDWGAEVRVSYDIGSTRLHAKAWLFQRDSGFSTAYVGSSNLTHTAMHDGLEWNVRLTQAQSPGLLERLEAAFETYWEEPHFVSYERERFALAVLRQHASESIDFTPFDIVPFEYQREMLDALTAERDRGHWRNLVVAATGTGKTIVAALDYKRLQASWKGASLLFVAHRREILHQSRSVLRHVMRDGSFGELLVGGEPPPQGQHVFASIQSLTRLDLATIAPDAYDIVIIDEFHHAEAPTYRRLLEHLRPRLLLGLTATPERTDGGDVRKWFDNRIACELRLWDALSQGLLSPFQYFGVADDVDLSAVEWRRGGYDLRQLSHLYTGNDARTAKVLQAVRSIVASPQAMRCLGFCVSVEHAEYMTEQFNRAGLSARLVIGASSAQDRAAALQELREGLITTVFSVDVYNEGVDIPEVDTILLLRPTESATLFTQQLGRGLRLCDGKSGLTVLDFIGQQQRKFRFRPRFEALVGLKGVRLERAVQEGFPYLPSGCSIELDRVASQTVLDNIRQSINLRRDRLLQELRRLGDVSLQDFLSATDTPLEAIYASAQPGWHRLRRSAGVPTPEAGPHDAAFTRAVGRMLHITDPGRAEIYRTWLTDAAAPNVARMGEREIRLLNMLHFDLQGRQAQPIALQQSLNRIWQHTSVRQELSEVLGIVADGSQVPVIEESEGSPIAVHARYTGEEVFAGLGVSTAEAPMLRREGVRRVPSAKADVFFVTLRKSERRFSPTTMYEDYAISARRFHWQSQSTTSVGSGTARRYINHVRRGWRILLFARETGDERGFIYLGPAVYRSHSGDRPVSFVWELEYEMPPAFFLEARAAG